MKKKSLLAIVVVLIIMVLASCGGNYVADAENLGISLNNVYGGAAITSSLYAESIEDFENNMEAAEGLVVGVATTTKLADKFKKAAVKLMKKQTKYYIEHWDEKESDSIDANMREELEDYYQDCADIYAKIEKKADKEDSKSGW